MTRYSFVSDWRFDASIEAVWEALADSERWPQWWPGVVSVVELEPGADDGVGNLRRYVFRGPIPYRLAFEMRATRIERPVALEGEAVGDLEGSGRWRLAPTPQGGTAVRYLWEVRTNRRWMNLLAPLLRPLFDWNHDANKRGGERGLRRHLERAGSRRAR
jgi:uncharacterized protein YndB with AHSA1/START domain